MQVRAEFEKSSPPRDFYITTTDVKNMRDALNNTSWRRAGNEATQVEQLVQEMGGAVFLYQPQETVGEGAARKVRRQPHDIRANISGIQLWNGLQPVCAFPGIFITRGLDRFCPVG